MPPGVEDLIKYLIVPNAPPTRALTTSSATDSNPQLSSQNVCTAKQQLHTIELKTTGDMASASTHLTRPPPSQSGHGFTNSVSENEHPGIMTIEDFMSNYKPEHAARKVAATQVQTNHIMLDSNFIPVGARSSENTTALHDKYQKLGIPQPCFTYDGSSERGWTAKVGFPGLEVADLQDIAGEGIHSSKQQAKEAVSAQALEILRTLEEQGKMKKAGGAAARTSANAVSLHDRHQKLGIAQPIFLYSGSTDLGWIAEVKFPEPEFQELQGMKNESHFPNKKEAKEALSRQILQALEIAAQQGKARMPALSRVNIQQQPQVREEPGPNYIGQLLEYQRARGAPQPIYRDYRMGIRFACLIEIEGQPDPFGSLDSLHSSKKGARQGAASCAVDYFKRQGSWPEDFTEVGGIRKKKQKQAQFPLPTSCSSSLMAQDGEKPFTLGTSGQASYAHQVARLAVALSLPTPEWQYVPNLVDRDFHTVHCVFKGAGPHEGPIGEVRNILGKKKAKEECARLTLDYLNEVYEHRMAFGQRMMEDVNGGESLVQGALGKQLDDESEALEARRQFVKEMGGDSEGEMDYEDASDGSTSKN